MLGLFMYFWISRVWEKQRWSTSQVRVTGKHQHIVPLRTIEVQALLSKGSRPPACDSLWYSSFMTPQTASVALHRTSSGYR
jgi:hypothetical protein